MSARDREPASREVAVWACTRRVFMGEAVAVSAVALLPWAAAGAVPAPHGGSQRLLADWTIDDMWGVYPRYAEPIAFGRLASDADVAIAAIDAQLVA